MSGTVSHERSHAKKGAVGARRGLARESASPVRARLFAPYRAADADADVEGYAALVARTDVIALEGLVVDCVVGVYPHERNTLQPLKVDLYMEVGTRRAAEHERLRDTVDYAVVAAEVQFLLTTCRFGMLETAAHALSRLLLAAPALGQRRAPIEALRLRLTKPYALSGRATPYLEIHRDASDVSLEHEDTRWGRVDIVFETSEAGIYRLNVAPQSGIPLHTHRVMRESELVLSDGLHCQGKPVRPGSVFHWPHGAAHRYDNPTDRYQTILCVDAPSFSAEDEIEVEGEPTPIEPEQAFPPGASS
jgi:dihydroneopterin aldolase